MELSIADIFREVVILLSNYCGYHQGNLTWKLSVIFVFKIVIAPGHMGNQI